MPITKSAKKALRQSLKRKERNIKTKEAFKKALKDIKRLKEKGDMEKAAALLPHAYKTLDKAAKAGVIKKDTAGRKKSAVARLLKV